MARKTNKEYKEAAKRLENRFPSLEKLSKKRGKYTPAEKAQITRAQNVTRIMRMRVDERPERYKKYLFPAQRHPPESFYKKEARRLAKYTNDPKKYREWASEKKMTGAQKAAVRKLSDTLRSTENAFKLTKKQAANIPSVALVQSVTRKGKTEIKLNAIKLRNTGPDARITRVSKDGTLHVTSGGRKWKYIPVSPPEIDSLAQAGEDAFADGAQEIYIWTVHGRVGGGAEDMGEWLEQLSQQYMVYLSAADQAKKSREWLIGVAYFK